MQGQRLGADGFEVRGRQLGAGVREVCAHGLLRDAHLLAYRALRETVDHGEPVDLSLALGQPLCVPLCHLASVPPA
jgi:hypothetical protein